MNTIDEKFMREAILLAKEATFNPSFSIIFCILSTISIVFSQKINHLFCYFNFLLDICTII